MDLIVTKWIALEGAVLLERDYRQELQHHFPRALIDNVKLLRTQLDTKEEVLAASHLGAAEVQPLAEGGILTALWLLAEKIETGLEVDLRKIPIKQEIIELCEYFDLNPYYMLSGGALLIAAENGPHMVGELRKLDIPAAWIGSLVRGNDRLILNQGHVRYLDRPQKEELHKIYKEGWEPVKWPKGEK